MDKQIKYYRFTTSKNAKNKVVSSLNGEWVKTEDYKNLRNKYLNCKEEVTIENVMLKFAIAIENLNLGAMDTFMTQVLISCTMNNIEGIIEKSLKNKQKEGVTKDENN